MKTHTQTRWNALLVSLAVMFLWGGCATGDYLGDFNLISPEEEMQLGTQLSQSIAQQSTILNDPQIQGYVESVGKKLASVSADPNAPFQFHVMVDPNVNAFAIPGYHLYVQTGLIEAADTEAEMAAVMAHEMGHAEERHPTERLSRTQGVQMLASMVLGENPGQLQQLGASIVAAGGISAYSRSAEQEADQIAVYLLNRAGYDPGAMSSFFNKLLQLEQQAGGGGAGGMGAFFSTHPPTPDRIAAVDGLIQSFGAERANATSVVGNFEAIKARVRTAAAAAPKPKAAPAK